VRKYVNDIKIVPDQILSGTAPKSWVIKIGENPLPESYGSLEDAQIAVVQWLKGVEVEI
jgi:hypothetical protein